MILGSMENEPVIEPIDIGPDHLTQNNTLLNEHDLDAYFIAEVGQMIVILNESKPDSPEYKAALRFLNEALVMMVSRLPIDHPMHASDTAARVVLAGLSYMNPDERSYNLKGISTNVDVLMTILAVRGIVSVDEVRFILSEMVLSEIESRRAQILGLLESGQRFSKGNWPSSWFCFTVFHDRAKAEHEVYKLNSDNRYILEADVHNWKNTVKALRIFEDDFVDI